MADNVMAILQEVDKCVRCNGCVSACKREWHMKQETIGVMKVDYDQRLAIKSQKRVDMGPFLRFTCWHCPDPPCAQGCPFKAIIKRPNGAVDVDFNLCQPNQCKVNGQYPCVIECQRGGYPKPGIGSFDFADSDPKMQKCTLCSFRAGKDSTAVPYQNASRSIDLKSRLVAPGIDNSVIIPELKHEPACVMSCPAKAMVWDTQANIFNYLVANYSNIDGAGTIGWIGDGSMYWASKKYILAPPKADPFVEDHLVPAATGLLSGPLMKAAIVPTVLVGGLMALSARRTANEEEMATEGEVTA